MTDPKYIAIADGLLGSMRPDLAIARALEAAEQCPTTAPADIESLLAEIDNAPGIWGGLSGRAKRLVHQVCAILEAQHAQSLAAVHNAALEKAVGHFVDNYPVDDVLPPSQIIDEIRKLKTEITP